jgi:hypothetical protein
MIAGLLAVAAPLRAQSAWALWERPVDAVTGQPRGAWQRGELFEAERWCKGAMTRAINQTLAAGAKEGKGDPKAPLSEYQCLPQGRTPPSK